MAQAYTINCFDPNNSVQSDMAAIEQNFEALRTLFSGLAAPANPSAGMAWAHPGGVDGLRMRDVANSAWLAVLLGDANSKMWLYRNDAAPGMQVDATVTDKVLAIKGGSEAYDVSGGNNAGSWTISGLSSVNSTHGHSGTTSTEDADFHSGGTTLNTKATEPHNHTFSVSNQGSHNHTVHHAGTSRPSAAVGTLQKPVMT